MDEKAKAVCPSLRTQDRSEYENSSQRRPLLLLKTMNAAMMSRTESCLPTLEDATLSSH